MIYGLGFMTLRVFWFFLGALDRLVRTLTGARAGGNRSRLGYMMLPLRGDRASSTKKPYEFSYLHLQLIVILPRT